MYLILKTIQLVDGTLTDMPIEKASTEQKATEIVSALRKQSNSQMYSYCKI